MRILLTVIYFVFLIFWLNFILIFFIFLIQKIYIFVFLSLASRLRRCFNVNKKFFFTTVCYVVVTRSVKLITYKQIYQKVIIKIN